MFFVGRSKNLHLNLLYNKEIKLAPLSKPGGAKPSLNHNGLPQMQISYAENYDSCGVYGIRSIHKYSQQDSREKCSDRDLVPSTLHYATAATMLLSRKPPSKCAECCAKGTIFIGLAVLDESRQKVGEPLSQLK